MEPSNVTVTGTPGCADCKQPTLSTCRQCQANVCGNCLTTHHCAHLWEVSGTARNGRYDARCVRTHCIATRTYPVGLTDRTDKRAQSEYDAARTPDYSFITMRVI